MTRESSEPFDVPLTPGHSPPKARGPTLDMMELPMPIIVDTQASGMEALATLSD